MLETLIGVLAIILAAVIFGVVLNPYFWQGFRNSKYWDEYRHSKKNIDSKELINPDNKNI